MKALSDRGGSSLMQAAVVILRTPRTHLRLTVSEVDRETNDHPNLMPNLPELHLHLMIYKKKRRKSIHYYSYVQVREQDELNPLTPPNFVLQMAPQEEL